MCVCIYICRIILKMVNRVNFYNREDVHVLSGTNDTDAIFKLAKGHLCLGCYIMHQYLNKILPLISTFLLSRSCSPKNTNISELERFFAPGTSS